MVSTQNNTVSRSKVDITGVPETMLQTLYARAKESRKPNHAIYDGKAIEIVDSLDYDFSLADKDMAMGSGVIARTIVLDKLVSEYLKKHKGAVVVNIACGLDTRCYRNEGRYKGWYNIDLPETMTVRAKFLQEDGPVYQIAESAMDGKWAGMVEYAGEPVLVIIEGLTMYLTEADVKKIFDIIDRKFTHATVFVETMAPFMAKHIKEKSIHGSHARFSWGVPNGKKLAEIIPKYRYIEQHSLVEGMAEFIPVYKVIGKIPFVSNISNKIVVMEK